MRRKLLLAVVTIILGLCSNCSRTTPISPADIRPAQPQQPTNPAVYQDFFQPINLSNDDYAFSIQFTQFSPLPSSRIALLPMDTHWSSCPEYCLTFQGLIISKPTIGGGVKIYLSSDTTSRNYQVGGGGIAAAQQSGTFAQFYNVPLHEAYPWLIVDWDYTVKDTIRGTKLVSTGFQPMN